jgi:hypothetical protein
VRLTLKKQDKPKEIDSDVNMALDIILFRLDRIEEKLDDLMNVEPKQTKAIILNLQGR